MDITITIPADLTNPTQAQADAVADQIAAAAFCPSCQTPECYPGCFAQATADPAPVGQPARPVRSIRDLPVARWAWNGDSRALRA